MEETASHRMARKYVFVDYSTQLYSAVVALLILLFHNETVPPWKLLLLLHGLIAVLIHWLVRAYVPGRSGPALSFFRHFYPVLLYTGFFCEAGWLNRMFCAEYLDPVIIGWDQALFGCQPSVLFMDNLPFLAVSELFYLAYFSYYIMITGVGVALFLRDRSAFFHYVSVVSFLFYACYLIYIFVPVIGPRVFFYEVNDYQLPAEFMKLAGGSVYPENLKTGPFYLIISWIYKHFEAPGAAMPSSHVAVALCTVWFSFKYLKKIRYAHLVMALLLCASTIYCRYHYAVDVIAGMLTAALLVPLGNWLYQRFRS
jgi:membrane-associated phospholipid phosphatase